MLRPVLFLWAAVAVLAQCHRASSAERLLYRSKKNFQENCATCHGTDVAAFVQKPWKHGNSRLELLQSMTGGLPNVPNHDFSAQLNDKQRLYLADYLLQQMVEQKEARLQAAAATNNRYASEGMTVELDTVARDLENPWGMAFLPNNDLLVTEIIGKLWRVDALTRQKTEVRGVPTVLDEGQGGLLDIKLHPRFETNQMVYFTYSKYKDSLDNKYSTTAVFRAQLVGDSLVNGRDIFVALPYTTTRYHYGSRLEFDREQYLYVSVGDRGKQDSFPQNLATSLGKIHRIREDGSIPDDNPFVNTPGAVPSIWSYGHRNPQGLALNPVTGALWETEHGPRGGDEVNVVQRGMNYGWPLASYGTHYDGRSFTEKTRSDDIIGPLDYWVPSIAPCGLTFCDSDRYPVWKGDLLAGSLRFRYLDRCDLGADGQGLLGHEALLPRLGRMRCIAIDREGFLYVSVEGPGFVFRLQPIVAQ